MSSLLLFTGCRGDEDVYSKPAVTVSPNEDIRVDANVQSKTIQINTNRTWKVKKENTYDWIDIAPMEGEAGTSSITVTVKSNEGVAREGIFTIVSSIMEYPINVIQADKDGNTIEYTTIEKLREMYEEAGQSELVLPGAYKLKAIVISDRSANNLPYKNGYIQDETGGIAFRVNDNGHSYNLGQILNIKLNGATLSKYGDALQLGFSVSNGIVQGEGTLPEPKELTIEEIESGNYEGRLVKIKEVQFQDYQGNNYQEGKYSTNRTLENCAGKTIIVRTSNYAKFKDEPLPAGKGNLTGILSWYKRDASSAGVWQLYLRNLDDAAEMSNDPETRCDGGTVNPGTGTKVSIADIRATLKDGQTYEQEHYIEGEVVLNPANNNVPDFVVYVADETAGISLTFTDKDNILSKLPLGGKVKVYMKGLKSTTYNGLVQLGSDKTLATTQVELVDANPSTHLSPKVVTIADVLAGKYQSQLVQINNVQFKNADATYSGGQDIENQNSESITVYTRSAATFSDEKTKSGSGAFIGIVSSYNTPQLIIRKTDDLSGMTGARFNAAGISVDNTSLTFEMASGSKTVNITSTVNWTASSDKNWCTISPTSGSNNGQITVTVAENTDVQRSATITIGDDTHSATISVTQKGTNTGNAATDLFISEYVEGGGYNKVIEIYNGTGNDVDLSAYSLKKQTNGADEYKNEFTLSGTLANGKTYVVANSQASNEIKALANTTSDVTNFNGNDAVALFKNGAKIDEVGVFNSSDEWGKDVTLRRKASVKSPKATYAPNEWNSLEKDDITDLGKHTMD